MYQFNFVSTKKFLMLEGGKETICSELQVFESGLSERMFNTKTYMQRKNNWQSKSTEIQAFKYNTNVYSLCCLLMKSHAHQV